MKYQNYPVECYDDLKQMLKQVAEKYPNRTAFLQKEEGALRAYRYGRYNADVNGLGTALTEMGLRDSRILLMGKNCYLWAVAYMAVINGVGVVMPVNSELSERELLATADYAQADAVICADEIFSKLVGLEKRIRVIPFSVLTSLIRRGRQRIKSGDKGYLNAKIHPNAPCTMMFSSGTWGEMRGVMLSHRNLCFGVSEMRRMVQVGEGDVFLSVLPMHHIYECTCGFLCPLSCGASVAFSEGLERIGVNLREVSPTVMICVPAILEGMYRRVWEQIRRHGAEARVKRIIDVTNAIPNPKLQLSAKQKSFAPLHKVFGGKLRLLITGGATASAEAVGGFRDLGILALQGYGMTECAPVIALNRDTLYRDGAAGLPTPNALLDIVDMQEDGIGEIRYRGDGMMLGYYRMPKRTQAVIRDGWFYTGDLGYLDEDGFLYVLGRAENVITLSDGRKILPEEIEGLLCRSPYIKEAVVVANGQENGEIPHLMALLCPDRERIAETYGVDENGEQTKLLMRRVLAEVNGTLPAYKRIESFLLRPEGFPKTATGKIKRSAV